MKTIWIFKEQRSEFDYNYSYDIAAMFFSKEKATAHLLTFPIKEYSNGNYYRAVNYEIYEYSEETGEVSMLKNESDDKDLEEFLDDPEVERLNKNKTKMDYATYYKKLSSSTV